MNQYFRLKIISLFFFCGQISYSQEEAMKILLADSMMAHSSVSVSILDVGNNEIVYEFNPDKSLVPASIQKLVTSSAAIELLGPDFKFTTRLGYTGNLKKSSGRLTGDIIIMGGGDPSLGSKYFLDHYRNFLKNWITYIRGAGIKKIDGSILADDSRYDYQPAPAKWLWEDLGNYYGAGVYGLSVFDNTFEIHFTTGENGSIPVITKVCPEICGNNLINWLVASGDSDNGYVFAAPYSNYGWISGSIPVNKEDFVLKASISDPPLLLAEIVENMLDSAGIRISGTASTFRKSQVSRNEEPETITELTSPELKTIIEVLNHESINLFAEHLLKELGKIFQNSGTTDSGIEVVYEFLQKTGINTEGIFLQDGSGLSPLNAISSKAMAELLVYMKTKANNSEEFFQSLPEAGKEGTLKNYFHDPVFESRLRAKSGSITRVRSYAGYLRSLAGNDLAFCIIINNYSGSSQRIIKGIEGILKEAIMHK